MAADEGLEHDRRVGDLHDAGDVVGLVDEAVAKQAERLVLDEEGGQLIGVRKAPSGRYEAAHRVNGRKVQLGSFDTAVEAAVAYARAAGQAPAVVTEADGLRLHVSSGHSTGFRCVYASDSGRYQARRDVEGRDVFLGTYDTAVEAAVAYARAVGEAPAAGEVGGVACEAAVVSEAGGMRLHVSKV